MQPNNDQLETNNNRVKNFFIRLIPGKGKSHVPGETDLDVVVPSSYDPEVEESKTNNHIARQRNLVWLYGGITSITLIILLPILSWGNVFFLSFELTKNKPESQLVRIEKLYNDARESANDITKMIVPSLFAMVVASVFNYRKENKSSEE